MKLDLANDERAMLLRLVRAALRETRFPLSLKAERLRALAAKLEAEEKKARE